MIIDSNHLISPAIFIKIIDVPKLGTLMLSQEIRIQKEKKIPNKTKQRNESSSCLKLFIKFCWISFNFCFFLFLLSWFDFPLFTELTFLFKLSTRFFRVFSLAKIRCGPYRWKIQAMWYHKEFLHSIQCFSRFDVICCSYRARSLTIEFSYFQKEFAS